MLKKRPLAFDSLIAFLAIFLVIIFLTILLLFSGQGFVRLLAGIPFVFFLPGYLFLLILWPDNGSIEQIRRIALIIPTSVAIVGILLLIVNYFFSYQFEIMVILIASLELILTIAAMLRSPHQTSFRTKVYRIKGWVELVRSRPLRTDHIVLGLSFLVFGASLTYAFITPRQQRELTEFYLLDPSVFTVDHPYVEKQGEPLNVAVAVHNLESGTHEYGIEIWAVDPHLDGKRQLVNGLVGFSLQEGEILESSLNWTMPWDGEGQGVEIMLFIDDEPEPYRHLILELDIEE